MKIKNDSEVPSKNQIDAIFIDLNGGRHVKASPSRQHL